MIAMLEFRENQDSKETVTFSSTVIKLCEVLHFFNIKRSALSEKKIVQSFHVEKKFMQTICTKKEKFNHWKIFTPLPWFLMVHS